VHAVLVAETPGSPGVFEFDHVAAGHAPAGVVRVGFEHQRRQTALG